jgi:hypothetical protein
MEDPLLLFSALHTFYWTYLTAFDGAIVREGAEHLLAFAEKQGVEVMRIRARSFLASVLMFTGNFAKSRIYYDQVLALYDPIEHRSLSVRIGADSRVMSLIIGSQALWLLGYPDAAAAGTERGLSDAREIGHTMIFMQGIAQAFLTQLISRDHTAAKVQSDELLRLAEKRGPTIGRRSDC